jgi:hypothetical protein
MFHLGKVKVNSFKKEESAQNKGLEINCPL